MKFNLKNLRREVNSLRDDIEAFESAIILNRKHEAFNDTNRTLNASLSINEHLPHTLFLVISAYYRAFNTLDSSDNKSFSNSIVNSIHISETYFINACHTPYAKDIIPYVLHTTFQARQYDKLLPQYKHDFITNIKHCISYLPEIVHA